MEGSESNCNLLSAWHTFICGLFKCELYKWEHGREAWDDQRLVVGVASSHERVSFDSPVGVTRF
jgi:hypothetical protein